MTTHQPAATHGGKARTMSNNNLRKILYTSESVGKGHPDKICDQISDAILDACLQQDQNARVACECFACNHLIVIGGEITTTAVFNPVQIAKSILTPLGYDQNEFTIISNINQQSTDIAKLVDKGKNVLSEAVGAGDQGITVGYATDETSNYMPLAIDLANEIVKSATKLIEHKQFPYANYDMKSQVTIDYSVPKKPKIDTLLVSIQHQKFPSIAARTKFKNFIKNHIFAPIVKKYHLNTDYKTFINQAGDFITGGPIADTGLTGRKIIVDNYGLGAHHGGGCYSGKDYTKVDRTGAYFARWIAKNLVASGACHQCEIQLSWCIGVQYPVAFYINTFGTNLVDEDLIYRTVTKLFSLRLYDIIKTLKLDRPIYRQTAYFGHYGRNDLQLPWEQLNMVTKLKSCWKK